MTSTTIAPQVMTFRQFAARGGYDCEISHDRLRFPHGITKAQARRNRDAAEHHLGEALRAMRDYNAACAEGRVRPPTADEDADMRILAHPDHESTKATWRLAVKRIRRSDTGINDFQAVETLLVSHMGGTDPWARELGQPENADLASLAWARLHWMQPAKETVPAVAA